MAAVAAERRKHARSKHWWIIHPFSYLRFIWQVFMTITYTISFFTIPFMISFIVMDYEEHHLDKINLLVYAIYWLDILFHCISGYYDRRSKQVVLDPVKILKSYLKGFLIPDALSSLPYDHMTLPWRRRPGDGSYRIVTIANVMPFIKLCRYPTLNSNMIELFTHLRVKVFYQQMFRTLLFAVYVMFWFSCFCYLMPVVMMHFFNIPPTECEDCWMTGVEKEGLIFRFLHALFIVLENLSASGYGLFVTKTDGIIIISTVLMWIGRLYEAYIIIMFLQYKAGKKACDLKFQEIIDQLTAFIVQKQLPPYMKKRLIAYYHYRFRNSYFHEKQILNALSEQLREEIALQSCRRLVENVAIFQNLPHSILQSIVKQLRFELYLPNDVIAKSGSQGDCMFFLSSGTVAVLTPTGKEICHLEDGAYFGEIALLVPDQRRIASVVALEMCEVYRLSRKDFRKCIAVHTELFAKMERTAAERIERTIMIEEQQIRLAKRASQVAENLQKKKSEK